MFPHFVAPWPSLAKLKKNRWIPTKKKVITVQFRLFRIYRLQTGVFGGWGTENSNLQIIFFSDHRQTALLRLNLKKTAIFREAEQTLHFRKSNSVDLN